MKERTLAIIKPDAWPKHGGEIITMATEAGLVPVKVSLIVRMEDGGHQRFPDGTCACSVNAWRNFYYEHRERPFFEKLVRFMASGPALAMALEGEGAVAKWRSVLGPTDPRKARADLRGAFETVRGRFGAPDHFLGAVYPMWENAAHGSDSFSSAARELAFFFGDGGAR